MVTDLSPTTASGIVGFSGAVGKMETRSGGV